MDLFGDPIEDKAAHMETAQSIKDRFEECGDVASVNALELECKEKMIEWRDHGSQFQKDMVVQIRNIIRYRKNILRH